MERYILSEMLICVPVLYLIGMCAKKLKFIPDNLIPLILGALGIILACLQRSELSFLSITQGILCAGASVYSNQLIKQGSAGK